ncbi:hypothetical protein LOK49_LG12G00369 [Camellia lanceoleosa]|uniref:Uncharacterized protein n=1 Tax=Camellia lanceoleosa TaxID=1840588 RepID=A0ACC0FPN0_9ERIC|nr:hypothetical protein LOK49_LG12G00369 [Camellia lanceoleosa]
MAVFNSWNSPLRSHTFLCSLLFFYFVIALYYFPLHANALSFNLTNIDPTVKNIVIEGDAYVSNKGIQIIPVNEVWKAGRATYKDPLHLWDKASGKLTDFDAYLLFALTQKGTQVLQTGLHSHSFLMISLR